MHRRLGITALATSVLLTACSSANHHTPASASEEDQSTARRQALASALAARGIDDKRVLAAIRRVPRHRFVPPEVRDDAYEDRPLPIGYEQTISQPYVVALMTALAEIDATDRVLEIGTGSGYQAAILAELGARVWSIEIIKPLAQRAGRLLHDLGYAKVYVKHGDGYAGWPTQAPFDAVIITAAPPRIPEPLKAQVAMGGRLVVPEGRGSQKLVVLTRTPNGFERTELLPVIFVPMTGQAQRDSAGAIAR